MQPRLATLLLTTGAAWILLAPNSILRADEARAVGRLDRSTQFAPTPAAIRSTTTTLRGRPKSPEHQRPRSSISDLPVEVAHDALAASTESELAHEIEKQRLAQCAGRMSPKTYANVVHILRRRIAVKGAEKAGLKRFTVVGASASRASEFLTGFANEKRYTLAADWEFLRPTIEWFSSKRRSLSSFARKTATVSGTTAGNWIWKQSFCVDCPQRLREEIHTFKPAFALLMFGTNNVSWGGRPGYERYFKKWIAAGYNDARCDKKGRCLPPYEPGTIDYPDAKAEGALPKYIAKVMRSKRKMFRVGYKALLDELLQNDIVPIISTIPPMPRRWLDEDTVVAVNEEIRALAVEYSIPMVDLWCALNPMDAEGRPDWTHPIMANNKGIGNDRYHPQGKHAFDVDTDYLVHGYLVRNVLTLLRLSEMKDVSIRLLHAHDQSIETAHYAQ